MSRIKNLQRKRRLQRQKLKTTITGLALTLCIGTTGMLSSYSYFTDREEINNDLEITLGTLETNISKDINLSNLKPNDIKTDSFEITNKGSLKQEVSINFSDLQHNIDYDKYTNSDKITYSIKITQNNNEVNTITHTISDLNHKSHYIGILNPEGTYKCEVEVKSGDIRVYEDSKVNFNLQVESIQFGGGK